MTDVLENIDEIIDTPEIEAQIAEKQDEINELIDETQAEIAAAGDEAEVDALVLEAKKRVAVDVYDAVAAHDDVEEFIEIDGDETDKEEALEAVTDTLVQDDSYTVMITTDEAYEPLRDTLQIFDPAIEVSFLFTVGTKNFYEIVISQMSILGEEALESLNNGVLPSHVL